MVMFDEVLLDQTETSSGIFSGTMSDDSRGLLNNVTHLLMSNTLQGTLAGKVSFTGIENRGVYNIGVNNLESLEVGLKRVTNQNGLLIDEIEEFPTCL